MILYVCGFCLLIHSRAFYDWLHPTCFEDDAQVSPLSERYASIYRGTDTAHLGEFAADEAQTELDPYSFRVRQGRKLIRREWIFLKSSKGMRVSSIDRKVLNRPAVLRVREPSEAIPVETV